MDDVERSLRMAHFVEEIAVYFEREGLPRMYGRILGHLLVCSPAHQSSGQLAEALTASKGAISQATRALLQAQLIQRRPMPGSRATYFEMRPGTMDQIMHGSIARIRHGREITERGLELIAGLPPHERERLEEFRDVFGFMEREYPLLLERWDVRRRAARASHPVAPKEKS